jgi:DNA-binding protein Fis
MPRSLISKVSEYEANIIAETMDALGNNQQKVADALGIPRTTLRSKLMKYGMLDISLE